MERKISFEIRRLQHIGIPVTDLAVSEAFYSSLGFRSVMQAGFTDAGEPGTCVMMQQHEITIELYQMPAGRLDEIRSRKDGHIDHIAFDTANIDEAFAQLKNASFNIMEEAPVYLSFWKNGCKYFNILGPDGERLEFNQIL